MAAINELTLEEANALYDRKLRETDPDEVLGKRLEELTAKGGQGRKQKSPASGKA